MVCSQRWRVAAWETLLCCKSAGQLCAQVVHDVLHVVAAMAMFVLPVLGILAWQGLFVVPEVFTWSSIGAALLLRLQAPTLAPHMSPPRRHVAVGMHLATAAWAAAWTGMLWLHGSGACADRPLSLGLTGACDANVVSALNSFLDVVCVAYPIWRMFCEFHDRHLPSGGLAPVEDMWDETPVTISKRAVRVVWAALFGLCIAVAGIVVGQCMADTLVYRRGTLDRTIALLPLLHATLCMVQVCLCNTLYACQRVHIRNGCVVSLGGGGRV